MLLKSASSSFDNTIRLWKDNSEFAILEGHSGPVFGITWTPDGKTLASAGMDEIILWMIK